MVCEKTPDCDKNMDEDGLDLEVNGDFISAKGTTLGGDDGIAVAYALAILDDDSIAHPRLEFVCTVSEEVGMEGASSIDVSMLKGKSFLIWIVKKKESCLQAVQVAAVAELH